MQLKKHLTLKRKMVAIFAFLIIMPTIIIYAYQNMVVLEYLHNEITKAATETLNYHNSLVEKKIRDLADLLFDIIQQDKVQKLLRKDDFSDGSIYLAHKDISSAIYFLENAVDTEILSLSLTKYDSVIYQYKHSIFSNNESTKDMLWYSQSLLKKGKINWVGIKEHQKSQPPGKYPQRIRTIDLSRAIYDQYTRTFIGTAYLSVVFDSVFYSDYFEDRMIFFQNTFEPSYIYTDDVAKEFIPNVLSVMGRAHSSAESGASNITINSHEYLLFYTQPNAYGWRVLELASQQKVMSKIYSVRDIVFILATVTLTMFLFFLFTLFRSLINPIQSMFNYINYRTNRDESDKKNTHFHHIDDMNNSIVSLVQTNVQIKEDFTNISHENNKNKYKRLQMQINPHFLYNTLNSIKILAETNRTHLVSIVTTNLVKILSACMDKNGLYIRVADEIDVLKKYTEIQQIVYGDSILFVYEIDSVLNDLETPNFILQPIVENSISHGLDSSKSQHIIKIRNYLAQDSLFFEIIDTGLGMSKDVIERINRDLNNDEKTTHIGIKSVHKRIEMSYGKEYGVSIESQQGVGSIFTIKLPVNKFRVGEVQ